MDVITQTQVTTKYAASSARTVGLKNRAGVSKLERLNIQTTECSTESALTASSVTTTELSSEISASSAYGKSVL